jgi:hypothetical protein
MAKKLRRGRLTMKEERLLIAMATTGITVEQAAVKFRTTAETIQRKAKRFAIQLTGSRLKIGPKGK